MPDDEGEWFTIFLIFSILFKFSGNMQPGITLRDIVHSIPYYARQNGLLTLDKKKSNFGILF